MNHLLSPVTCEQFKQLYRFFSHLPHEDRIERVPDEQRIALYIIIYAYIYHICLADLPVDLTILHCAIHL